MKNPLTGQLAWLILSALYGCREDKPVTFEPPSYDAAAPVAPSCPGCGGGSTNWTFNGFYSDAACTRPVANGMVPQCSTAETADDGRVGPITFTEPVGTAKQYERKVASARGFLDPRAGLFRKAAGRCAAYAVDSVKVMPPECHRQKVCRTKTGELGCSDCVSIGKCPAYEGSMAYVEFEPPR